MQPQRFIFSRLQQFLRKSHFRYWKRFIALLLLFTLSGVAVAMAPVRVTAQSLQPVQQAEEQVIRELALPEAPRQRPVYRARTAEPAARPAPRQRTQASERSPNPAPRASSPSRRSTSAAQRDASPQRSPRPAVAPAAVTPAAVAPAAQRATPATQSPQAAPQPPKVEDITYEWEFNRSPETQNRLRLEGVYPKTRLGFTRALDWEITSAKAVIQFRQSASLLPDRSNLTVRINDTSIGTVPLNRTNGQVATVAFDVPTRLIQPQNEIAILAEQQTSEDCTNPNLPTLWTEILPTSKLVFTYQYKPVALDFSRYPYPLVDEFNPEPNRIAYLRPQVVTSDWLTATARFQAQLGRLLNSRPVESRVIDDISKLQPQERLVVIGTPESQSLLTRLDLPFPLAKGRILDGEQKPLPNDIGVLMLTTLNKKQPSEPGVTANEQNVVLVAAANSPSGMSKAVQYLVQSPDRKLGTGQALVVNNLEEVSSPKPRDWVGYLPNDKRFTFGDLSIQSDQFFVDTTVRGSKAPEIRIPFHALPGDRVLRNSTVTLQYSYGPQINPRTSTVELALDDTTLGAQRLSSDQGGRGSFTVNLPQDMVRPTSNLFVRFLLNPLENGVCGLEADQQIWGTVHSNSSVYLVKDTVVQLPDLELLKVGYPLAAPQDLSTTAMVLPDRPNSAELEVMLSASQRLGRISHANSVKLNSYLAKDLSEEVKANQNIVAIGTSDRLPVKEAMDANTGLSLGNAFTRRAGATQLQALPDSEGVVRSTVSPWNDQRVLLALTAQQEQGLRNVEDLIQIDRLFGQLQGDTAFIQRNQADPSPFDPEGYSLEFLNQVPRQKVVVQASLLGGLVMFLQENWLLLPLGIILLPLLLYGFSHMFLNRVNDGGSGL